MATTDSGIVIPDKLHREAKHESKMVGNPITADGLAGAINREIRRKLERQMRREAKKAPEPIIVPKPLNDKRAALDKVVDILVTSPGGMYRSTIFTLARELDGKEGRELVRAYDSGLDLPRASIRRALASIHARGETQRAEARTRARRRAN